MIRMYNSTLRRFFVCFTQVCLEVIEGMPVIVQKIRKRVVHVPKRQFKKRHWVLTFVFFLLLVVPFVYILMSSEYNLASSQNSDSTYWIIRGRNEPMHITFSNTELYNSLAIIELEWYFSVILRICVSSSAFVGALFRLFV